MIEAARLAVLVTDEGTDKVAGNLRGLGDTLENAGKKAALAGGVLSAAITTPLLMLGNRAVDAASDMAESMSKVNVVFDDSAGFVADFAAGAAQNLGMTQQLALDTAGSFGNMFDAMGIADQASAEMSTGLLQMAADLGSFNNIDPSIMLEKLRSGLVGEVEPLRAVGVMLDAASVKAQAMAMGLAATEEALTQADLAQARYALIVAQSGNAMGDFARTSDGMANSSRILSAQMNDLMIVIGQRLLPIKLQLMEVVRGLIDRFQSLSPGVQDLIVKIGMIAAAAGPVLIVLGTLATALGALLSPIGLVVLAIAGLAAAWATNFGGIRDAVQPVIDAIIAFGQRVVEAFGAAKAQFDELRAGGAGVFEALTASVATFVGSFVDMERVGDVIQRIREVWAQLVEFFTPTIERLKTGFQDMVAGLAPLGAKFQELWAVAEPVLRPLAEFIAGTLVAAFNLLLEIVASVMGQIGPIISTAIDVAIAAFELIQTTVEEVVAIVTAIFEGDWAAVWEHAGDLVDAFGQFFETALLAVVDTANRLLQALLTAVSNWLGNINLVAGEKWQAFLTTAQQKVQALKETVQTKLAELKAFIGGFSLRDVGEALINGMIEGIRAAAGALVNAAVGVVQSAIQAARNLLGIHSPSTVFKVIGFQMIEGLIEGIDQATPEATQAMADALETLMNSIGATIDTLGQLGDFEGLVGAREKVEALSANIVEVVAAFMPLAELYGSNSQHISAKAVTDALKPIFENLKALLDGVKGLAEYEAVGDVAGKMENLAASLQAAIEALATITIPDNMVDVTLNAGLMADVADALAGIAKAWESIGDFEWSDMDVSAVMRWLASFGALATQAASWAATWAATGGDSLKAFGETVKTSLGALVDAAKAWETIQKFQWSDAPVEPILRWLASFAAMATQAAAAAAAWAATGGDSLKAFGETVKTSMGALVDAAKAWETIQKFTWADFEVAPILRWLASFAAMATQAAAAAAAWAATGGDSLKAFGETVKTSLGALVEAAKAWETISGFQWANLSVQPVLRWLAALGALATQAVAWAAEWGSSSAGIKPFAEAMRASFGALSSAVAFVEDLRLWKGSADLADQFVKFRKLWEFIIEEFARTRRSVRLLLDDELRQFAQGLGDIAGGLSRAMDLLMVDMSNIQVPAEQVWGPFIAWLVDLFADLVTRLRAIPALQDPANSEFIQQFSAAISAVMGAIKTAVDVALALPQQWATPSDSVILPVVDWMMHVFQLFTQRLRDWFPDTAEEALGWPVVQQFAQAVGAVLAAIRDAALLALELPREWATPPDSVILPVIDWMMHVFQVFTQRLADWFPDTVEEAQGWPVVQQFAQAVGSVLTAIRDAALLALELPREWTTPPDSVILPVIDWMMHVFQMFEQRFRASFPDTTDEARNWPVVQQFAQAVGVVLTAIRDAALLALQLPASWTAPADSVVQPVIDWMIRVFQMFSTRLLEVFPDTAAEAKNWPVVVQFAQAVGVVLTAIRDAALLALQLPASWTAPADSVVQPVIDWMIRVFQMFSTRLVAVFPDTAAEAKTWPVVVQFAQAVGVVLGAIRDAALLALDLPKTWTAPADAIVQPVIDWMIRVFQLFSTRLTAAFPDTAEEAKAWPVVQQFAQAVGVVLGAIKTAVDVAAALPDTWTAPSQAMLDNVIEFVQRVFTRFYDWINSKNAYAGKQIPFGTEGLALVQAFGGALQSLMGGLGASFDVFAGLLSFVPPSETRLIAFVDAVKTTINTVNQRIVSTLTPAATAAIGAFGSALQALMSGLSASLNLFRDLAGTAPGTYTPGTAGAEFETRIGNLMQGVSGTLTAFKTYVQQKVGSEWIPASQVFLNATQQVFGVLTTALNLFRDLATTGMPSSAQLTTFVNAVLAIFRGFATDLTAMATPIQVGGARINEGLIAGLTSKLSGITGSNTVEGAARQVSATVYNIVKDNVPSYPLTMAYGQQVDQGLIDGMNNKLSSVATTAYTVGRIIDQQMRLALGISSPSKAAMEAGGLFGEGLALGMEGQLGAVRAAALGLAGAMGLNGPELAFAGPPQQMMLVRHEVAVTSPDGSVGQIDINRLADRLAPVMRDGIRSRRF